MWKKKRYSDLPGPLKVRFGSSKKRKTFRLNFFLVLESFVDGTVLSNTDLKKMSCADPYGRSCYRAGRLPWVANADTLRQCYAALL